MFKSDLLKAQRILITGGGTGIGKSIAKRFVELGAEILICGRRESVLAETAAELSAGGRPAMCAMQRRSRRSATGHGAKGH